jgi:folate-binding protein YgfZ
LEKFIIMEDIIVEDVSAEFSKVLLGSFDSLKEGHDLPQLGEFGLVLDEWRGLKRLTTIMVKKEYEADVLGQIRAQGFVELSPQEYEELRVSEGIPAFPNELNELRNPLEAGLRSLVSWTKGCYVGQEVIARLDTYKKVQQRLVTFDLEALPPELPSTVYAGYSECGELTSASWSSARERNCGLGFVRYDVLSGQDDLHISSGTGRIGGKVGSVLSQG